MANKGYAQNISEGNYKRIDWSEVSQKRKAVRAELQSRGHGIE